jgi:hypothetical protein
LVIFSQPFPDSVKQNKPIDDCVEVKILLGARSLLQSGGNAVVKADLVKYESSVKKKKNAGLENCEKPLSRDGVAVFNDLKFPSGTRLKSVRLRFTTSVAVVDETTGHSMTLSMETSPASYPIVVKTNENQWGEAEGMLLRHSIFENSQLPSAQSHWFRFVNWLQRRYLQATKQNLHSPARPLTQEDFRYISRLKFGGDSPSSITAAQFDRFWEWFGPSLHKLRYSRHLGTLWTQGLVAGFLTREEADHCLRNEQPGTFLIRFSERAPGKFAVAFQGSTMDGQNLQLRVKHYLLKNDDTMGAKKTLPDFLK